MKFLEHIEDIELGTMQLWELTDENVDEWNARETIEIESIDVAE